VEKPQQQRLALNEALFREVNERIREISDTFVQDDATHHFLCECSDPGCTKRVVLTRAEYEEVRSDPTRFVVAKGHVLHEIEAVVERAEDHVVVEKEGAAADIAIHLDTPNA
jgi:5-bromo-4-chloroindolyl phosphate hydrolysis protein